jgi:hypothetical protein
VRESVYFKPQGYQVNFMHASESRNGSDSKGVGAGGPGSFLPFFLFHALLYSNPGSKHSIARQRPLP